jgi:hypothetical protein
LMNLSFGPNVSGHIFVLEFWTKILIQTLKTKIDPKNEN